ncbi:hypothetical protein K1X12_14765 [Hyphomonas sp. WL0036]|uniref:hypothetical protein n=1 Tax=Hyphomonas sediminis TaxID=2866160 RepID=UPI001C8056E5|nr:hypothetical protein [Hyphomonas sediminis]MBY9068171.1 hypothetical protein [Hyphomonas sediminis]
MMLRLKEASDRSPIAGLLLLAGFALPFVVGCSGSSAPEGSGNDISDTAAAECGGLLNRSDIDDAFSGALTVQSTTAAAMGSEVAGCLVMIEEGNNNRLNLTVGDAEAFRTRKESQSRQAGGMQEAFDAGAEAQIYNGVYAIALLEDGRSISIGLSQKLVEEERLIAPDQSAAGIKLLAERVVRRLESR